MNSSKLVSPVEWCADLEAVLQLTQPSFEACKLLVDERYPNAPWRDEYTVRLWMAYDYFVKNLYAWEKAGFVTDEHVLKGRYLLFVFYGHYGVGDFDVVKTVAPSADLFIYGANRIKKEEDERKAK